MTALKDILIHQICSTLLYFSLTIACKQEKVMRAFNPILRSTREFILRKILSRNGVTSMKVSSSHARENEKTFQHFSVFLLLKLKPSLWLKNVDDRERKLEYNSIKKESLSLLHFFSLSQHKRTKEVEKKTLVVIWVFFFFSSFASCFFSSAMQSKGKRKLCN